MKQLVLAAVVMFPVFALAQATEFPSPPLVPAQQTSPVDAPPPTPAPEPVPAQQPPAQVRPGTPPPPQYVPNSPPTGYQYSPYGTPRTNEKPPLEWGLMISESLFGALTAAGITILPYFLLGLNGVAAGNGASIFGDGPVGLIIFILIFAATPLAVAQTQVSLANGSRYYYSDTWPAALAGLAAEGIILAIGYGIKGGGAGNVQPLFNGTFVLVASIAAVPLIQMAVINLFKSPRFGKTPGAYGALNYSPEGGLAVGMPAAAPVIGVTQYGMTYGVQVPLLSGRF